jgi:hypothetical protein
MKPHNISHRLRLEEERWKQIEKVHGIEQELQAVQYEIEWLSRMDGAQNVLVLPVLLIIRTKSLLSKNRRQSLSMFRIRYSRRV